MSGAATFNAAVTLGNGTPDDITILGSLAATIPIKTNNSFDFGSSTIGLAGLYLGAPSSRTTRLISNQAIGASYTFAFPGSAGSAGQVMANLGSGGTIFVSSADAALNLGLVASVAANALTIALKGADGADPSATNPVLITFRSATAATGTPVLRSVTAATSVVVSSGSTLGSTNGNANWVYVYALDNAGTIELAVSASKSWDEGSVQTTTAEGGAGGADSKTVLYSTTQRTDKAIRLLGRVKSTQATAGTWATAPSEISLVPLESNRVQRSEVYVSVGNGYGAVATSVRRFTTIGKNTGTAITYLDDANAGATFTINEEGLYGVSYSDSLNGNVFFGVSLDGTTTADFIFAVQQASGTTNPSCGGVLFLRAGNVVRALADGTVQTASTDVMKFRITKISD